ncbi:MAG: hypothetical protein AAFU67_05005 [Bacteroidota bacterium]
MLRLGAILFFLWPIIGLAQQDSSFFQKKLADYHLDFSIGLQVWGTYTYGMQVYREEDEAYRPVENRFNTQLRRSRFSLQGQPYAVLSFRVTASLDLVGRDVLAATEAGANNGGAPQFRLWNAQLKWQLFPDQESLYLLAGYLPSPVGGESNMSALRSPSFEKAWSQNYLRRHLMGTGPGRAAGILLGGQWSSITERTHVSYEIAAQNPVFQSLQGNTTGPNASLLWSGRLALQIGDPESQRYRRNRRANFFGKRNGVTLGMAAGLQGSTTIFDHSSAYGIDWLINLSGWHFDGEIFAMNRSGGAAKYTAHTGYCRLGKNIVIGKQKRVLEPVLSYWYFNGPMNSVEQLNAKQLKGFSGGDVGIDFGVNLYLNPDFKISLFYVLRHGTSDATELSEVNNNFFQQPIVGAIQRGNYVGLGWVTII